MNSLLTRKVCTVTGVSKSIGAGIAKGSTAQDAAIVANCSYSKKGANIAIAGITAKGGIAVALKGTAKRLSKIVASSLLLSVIVLLLITFDTFEVKAQKQPDKFQAGYYRMKLGDLTITALSDGSAPTPIPSLMRNIKPMQVKQLLALESLQDTVETSITIYLINTGTKLLLVDAGAGVFYGSYGGHLVESLRAAGYEPDQINTVLLTHLHSDHIGGLVQGANLTFPNADVYVEKIESDFWLNPADSFKVAVSNRHHFKEVEISLRPVINAGRLKPFHGNTELFQGIKSIATPGHTPGHTSYEIESKGEKLVLWGDVMHVAAVQFADPIAGVVTDEDPAAGTVQRKRAFNEAASASYWIGGDHLSFPGIGHLHTEGKKYRWVPINFMYNYKN